MADDKPLFDASNVVPWEPRRSLTREEFERVLNAHLRALIPEPFTISFTPSVWAAIQEAMSTPSTDAPDMSTKGGNIDTTEEKP